MSALVEVGRGYYGRLHVLPLFKLTVATFKNVASVPDHVHTKTVSCTVPGWALRFMNTSTIVESTFGDLAQMTESLVWRLR